jgi:hypothetical protein
MANAAFGKLWDSRRALNAYSRALVCLAAKALGRDAEAQTLAENLANGVQRELDPDGSRIDSSAGSANHEGSMQTAHWGADKIWNRWSEGPVETTAFALRALLAVEPTSPLAEQAVNWLLQNRRGAQWSNTRDTAIAILALDGWLEKSGEVARDVEYELTVNGKVVGRRKIGASEMLSAPAEFAIPAAEVKDGKNEIRLKKIAGEGPLYLAARANFFSQEEPIPARGSQIFVKRQYYKLVGRPTLLKGQIYERMPLEDGGTVASGERVEVVLSLEAKNDFEYLLFEDLKPAGLEAVELRSGGPCYARELKSGEVEHRFGAKARTSSPIRWTSRGTRTASGRCTRSSATARSPSSSTSCRRACGRSATTCARRFPGRFHALPTLGEAMYVPEIRCNGAETRVTVLDRGPSGD